MSQPGVIRQPGPTTGYKDAPLWIRTILNSAAAYGDFVTDIYKSINRCNDQIVEFLDANEPHKAQRMLGKREALEEMRFIVDAYRKEEEVKKHGSIREG
jgi:hypothetical protein